MTKLTHSFADFPFGLFLALGLAPIPLFLSLGESQLAFGDTLAKVDPQGHQSQTLSVKFSHQLVDLFLPEKQLPRSKRPMVIGPSGKVFADVAVQEPNLTATDHAIGIPQIGLALAERFHFSAKQHHACFQLLKKVIIVRSGAVLGHNQLSLFFLFFRRFSHGKVS